LQVISRHGPWKFTRKMKNVLSMYNRRLVDMMRSGFPSAVFHLTHIYIQYKMWVDPDQEYLIQYLEGVELLLQKESGLASFWCHIRMEYIRVCKLSCSILLVVQSPQISYLIHDFSWLKVSPWWCKNALHNYMIT
jgi:hypothetical protein